VVVVRRRGKRAFCIFAVCGAGASLSCKPDLDDRTSVVREPRVLAVRAEPAEAAPLAAVTLRALVVDVTGEPTGSGLSWAYCDARKPLAELGPVSAECLARQGDFLEPLGSGGPADAITGTIPAKACRQFGPEVPEAEAGQPAGRPVDPDATGGYYQPVQVVVSAQTATPSARGDLVALGRARLTCGIVGPTPDQLTDLARRSHPNTNPELDADVVLPADAGGGAPIPARAGERIPLRASWAACAPDATTCTGAESYASFDPATQAVRARREGLRLSWFTTAGLLDEDHTGRDEADEATWSDNAWTAPAGAGIAHLWVVLRDDRGGVGWRAYTFDVR
jgi:hypothetical protein